MPLHAWRALGQLADPRAIEPLIGAFDSLWEDDWALAELPVAVAMLGQNGICPLTEFLNDRSHAEFARAMAVDALEGIAERQPSVRDQVVTIITEYLEDPDRKCTRFERLCGQYAYHAECGGIYRYSTTSV